MDAEIIEDEIILELIAEPALEVEIAETEIVVEIGDGIPAWGSITGNLADQQDLADALAGKSDTGHTHDDRYYTEAETDTLLAGKSDTGHTHDDRYYTEAETDTLLAGKSDTGHTHDDRYYTEAESDTLLAGKSDTGHIHDDRYYTEAETDTLLDGKTDLSVIAEPFDSTVSHAQYSYVTHDGKFYRFTDAVPAGTTWAEIEYFEMAAEVDAGGQLELLKSELGSKANTTDLQNKVSKSGDTMTGDLTMKSTTGDNTAAPTGSSIYRGVIVNDKNNAVTGRMRGLWSTTENVGLSLEGVRQLNGSNVINGLSLVVKPDGTRIVSFTESAPWRTSLSVYSKAETDVMRSHYVQGFLANGTDLNDLTTPGVWQLSSNYTYGHNPATWGLLEVFVGENGRKFCQRLSQRNNFWIRHMGSSAWQDWAYFSMSPTIKRLEANCGNITLNANGWLDISSNLPNKPSGYTLLDIKVKTWSSVSTKDAFTVTWNSGTLVAYACGTAGATINGLKLNCIYILSDDLSES